MTDAVNPVLDEIKIIVPVLNPVHNVLNICGVTVEASRQIFIDIDGLHSIDAFAYLNGDSDVTEMAKRMACCTSTVGRVIIGTIHI
jgi:hypothetical protein